MTWNRRTTAALAALAITTGAGCGGGEDGEETAAPPAGDPADVVSEFYAAFADGDAERFCELVAAEDRVSEGGETCEESAADLLSGPFAGSFAKAKVGETIDEDGETATVEVEVLGERLDAELVAEDGEWKLDLGD